MRPLPFPLLGTFLHRYVHGEPKLCHLREPHLPLPWNLDLQWACPDRLEQVPSFRSPALSFSDSRDVRMTPVSMVSGSRFPRRPLSSGLRKVLILAGLFYFHLSGRFTFIKSDGGVVPIENMSV